MSVTRDRELQLKDMSLPLLLRCRVWQAVCGERVTVKESLVGRLPSCQPARERGHIGCQALMGVSFS